MALRHLVKPAPAAPVAPEPVPAAELSVPATTGSELAVFGVTSAGATLDALLAVSSGGPQLRFPVIKIQSGAKIKAAFMAPEFNDAEVRALLPEGSRPVEGVFLAHRLRVTAWPAGYDETATEPSKVVFSCYIQGGDTANTVRAAQAGSNYHFTKCEAKAKFDISAGGPGNIRTALEVLVWYPGLGGLLEIRCPDGHNATESTAKALRALCDPKTGALVCAPVSLTPVTQDVKTWLVQSLGFATLTGPTGAKLWADFNEWKALALADAETVEAVNAWVSGSDAPITDAIAAALDRGALL